ncbi:MAG: ATP-binding protein [Deltaproteobacteria bacterium]
MNFSTIPGQQRIKNELVAMTDNNRLPHAVLLTGPRGNGKLALALALSSYIQCENKNGTDKCGACPACKKTDKLIHPDINFIIPVIASEQKSKSYPELLAEWRKMIIENPFSEPEDWISKMSNESNTANINKEAINSVLEYFNYSLFEGSKKIMLIWNAELMSNEANRLLKLIEEPPKDSVIILIAEDTSKVLKTILSRCQIFRIPPFSDEDLEKWIRDKIHEDNNILRQMISISEGNISKLISLSTLDQTDFFELLIKWLNTSFQGIAENISVFSEEFSRMPKETQKQFFHYILRFLEQVHRSFELENPDIRLNQKELDSMEKLKTLIPGKKLLLFAEEVNKNIYYIDRNANSKLMIFETTLKLNRIFKDKSI